MTREEIDAVGAKWAKLVVSWHRGEDDLKDLEHEAVRAVEEVIRAAVEAEREACAVRAEDVAAANRDMPDAVVVRAVAERIARAIRARSTP